ncbi:MAG: hypothetical protein ACTSRZ_20415 [Promethearchaeota archaeon]
MGKKGKERIEKEFLWNHIFNFLTLAAANAAVKGRKSVISFAQKHTIQNLAFRNSYLFHKESLREHQTVSPDLAQVYFRG